LKREFGGVALERLEGVPSPGGSAGTRLASAERSITLPLSSHPPGTNGSSAFGSLFSKLPLSRMFWAASAETMTDSTAAVARTSL
jgi:hypothetical protein